MSKPKRKVPAAKPDAFFDRIVSILEQARGNVVRAVNTNMVLAYWLIGREIIQEMQGSAERAEYGKQVLENLSARLTERYGKGFSVPNLQNFRKFYQTFPDRLSAGSPIQYPPGTESGGGAVPHPMGVESGANEEILSLSGKKLVAAGIPYPTDSESGGGFLLIDLKIGKLTHRDVGQMDGYVRLFEDRFKVPGDNPTIGLILCSDKGEAVAKYSVLSEGRQVFASKYLQFLPSEEEFRLEIEKEHKLIEAALAEKEKRDV